MSKVIDGIKNEIKQNKIIYIIGLVVFFCLVYTHFNTFVANDDLPYSFFYRGNNRVTNIIQAFLNQVADYRELNGRFFVHSILQIILIFGKNLWAIINPLMIVTSLILIVKIIQIKLKKVNKLNTILLVFTSFFLMLNYKIIIYWVAGSVNYIWVLTLLLIILFLYFKYGFAKNKLVNIIIIAFLCALHECTMVFTIVFIIGLIVSDWLKNKKINKDYILYCIGFIGSLFLLLCPASQIRMSSDAVWNDLGLFSKLQLAIPVVSKNLFNLTDFSNILPYLFITFIIINLIRIKDKFSVAMFCLILINIISIYLLNNDWLYFSLIILVVLSELYCSIKNETIELFILSISMYAVVFSNIIIPLYYGARPNYYFYLYMIFYVAYNFNTVSLFELKKNNYNDCNNNSIIIIND